MKKPRRDTKSKQLLVTTEKVRELESKDLEQVAGGGACVCLKSWGVGAGG